MYFEVSFEILDNEEFPAVSLCFDQTLKWPGIINLASRMNKTKTPEELREMKWKTEIMFKIPIINMVVELMFKTLKVVKYNSLEDEFYNKNGDLSLDICGLTNFLFPKSKDPEINAFLVALSYQLETQLSISDIVKVNNTMKKASDFQSLRQGVCNLELFDCQNLQNDCVPLSQERLGLRFHIIIFLKYCQLWVYHKYFNAKSLLHVQHKYAFKSPEIVSSDKIVLLKNIHNISGLVDTDVYSQWHYMQGFYIENKGVGQWLIKKGLQLFNLWNDVCTKQDGNCSIMENYFQTIEESDLKKLKQLIDQPKLQSDNEDDFSLVPLCSFANDQLKKCDLFHRSRMVYQDHTCYTYDQAKTTQPFAPNGLNLLLNLKHMPAEQDLSLKLFFHQHGTIPDVLRLESTYQKVRGTGNIQVGLNIRSNEVTENFAKMSYKKRQCLLPGEQDNYTKIECLVEQIHKYAKEKCKCLPILMGGLANVSNNVECSICFRSTIQEAQADLNQTTCPSFCQSREFLPTMTVQPWDDPTENGQDDLVTILNDNTLHLYLDKVEDPNLVDPIDNSAYLKRISQSYSLLQIFFQSPQKTVITKDAKVTETDMVSNIGGTIGIFLGLSTISVLDKIIDWLVICYATKMDKLKNKRQL